MILLVGGEKGGSGKSCLAQNIAVYFSSHKNANVILVDCDPQRTTSDWVQERHLSPDVQWINCVQMYGKIRYELKSLEHHYDYVIVDCGGQDSVALRSAMSVASHVLLPLRPKRRDLKTLEHLEDLVSNCNVVNPDMIVACVLTQCPSLPNQINRILEAKEVVRSFNLRVLNSVTFSRNIYDDSEEKGMSVMDTDPDGKASSEIKDIISELLAMKAIQEDGIDRSEKNSTRSNKSQFTVEEFIADAENYAMGVPQIVSVRKATEDESVSILSQGPMRHATFTLSQEAIDALNKLSKDSGMPKSKLIRQLILSLNEQELRTVVKTTKPVVIKKVE